VNQIGSADYNIDDEFTAEELEELGIDVPDPEPSEEAEDMGASEEDPVNSVEDEGEDDPGEDEEPEDKPDDSEEAGAELEQDPTDEKPEETQATTETETDLPEVKDWGVPEVDVVTASMNTVVQLEPDHPDYEAYKKYNGMPIKDIIETSPGDGQIIYEKQKAYLVHEQESKKRELEESVQRQEREYSDFISYYGQDVLGREVKEYKDMTPDEFKDLHSLSKQLDDYAKKHDLTVPVTLQDGSVKDVPIIGPLHLYKLFKHDKGQQKSGEADKILSQAESKTKGAAPRVKSTKGEGRATGYEAYENMTREQVGEALDKMTDDEEVKFIRNAPKSLVDKFPDLFI